MRELKGFERVTPSQGEEDGDVPPSAPTAPLPSTSEGWVQDAEAFDVWWAPFYGD
jgi:hypothetical protein